MDDNLFEIIEEAFCAYDVKDSTKFKEDISALKHDLASRNMLSSSAHDHGLANRAGEEIRNRFKIAFNEIENYLQRRGNFLSKEEADHTQSLLYKIAQHEMGRAQQLGLNEIKERSMRGAQREKNVSKKTLAAYNEVLGKIKLKVKTFTVKSKQITEDKQKDLIDVKPNFFGVGFNLNSRKRRLFAWIKNIFKRNRD